MKNKVVLTLSGGADSAVLLYMAANKEYYGYDEIHTISFDYGQRHRKELDCVNKQLKNILAKHANLIITNKVIDVSFIKDIAPTSSLTNNDIQTPNVKDVAGEAQPASYVPFRNMIFTSIACAYAEALKCDSLMYGSAQADSLAGYYDGSIEWINAINDLVKLNREHKIKIITPLIDLSKSDIIKVGVQLGVNFRDTWTCYSGGDLPDANSVSSSLRLRGFIESGYKDPLQYIQQEQLETVYLKNNCKDIH